MKKISIAVPTYNSSKFIGETFRYILNDNRVDEVVINDDGSRDFDRLEEKLKAFRSDKIKVFRNEKNLKAYENKAIAVSKCKSDYVILLDSDNIITTSYLDKIFSLVWSPDTIYCPDFAKPLLDFRSFAGLSISKANISDFIKNEKAPAFLNDGNYFFKKKTYLEAHRQMPKDEFLSILDVLYFANHWVKQGNVIEVVEGLKYFHRHRGDSFFMVNKDKSSKIIQTIKAEILGKEKTSAPKKSFLNKMGYKLWAIKNIFVYQTHEKLKLYKNY